MVWWNERYIDENGEEQRFLNGYELHDRIIGISQTRRILEKKDDGEWVLCKNPRTVYIVGLLLMPTKSLDVIDDSPEISAEEHLEKICQQQEIDEQGLLAVKEEIAKAEIKRQIAEKNRKDRREIEQNILPDLFYKFGGKSIVRKILKEKGEFPVGLFCKLNEMDVTYQCPYSPAEFRVRQFSKKRKGKL